MDVLATRVGAFQVDKMMASLPWIWTKPLTVQPTGQAENLPVITVNLPKNPVPTMVGRRRKFCI